MECKVLVSGGSMGPGRCLRGSIALRVSLFNFNHKSHLHVCHGWIEDTCWGDGLIQNSIDKPLDKRCNYRYLCNVNSFQHSAILMDGARSISGRVTLLHVNKVFARFCYVM